MAGYANSSIAAYKSVATHGVALEADPHQLISMLMDGALERLLLARECILRKDIVQKANVLHRVGQIIEELRGSLNLTAGGDVAANLDRLYDYMIRRVLTANLENKVEPIDEALKLLRPIRESWEAIPPQFHNAGVTP